MSFGSILYQIIIGPLQLFFEIIYSISYRVIGNPGLCIIVLSLAMNFLVLPLYKRADEMQAEERDIEAKLHDGVAHIRKTFRGDDRMMMLQTYYRQNNYHPMDALKGSISLLLEIPFFIAAYRFLSTLKILEGVSFGPIMDLSLQDNLIHIANLSINALPILMTSINLISCVIYTKGYPLKTKIQLYAMAIFFLIFLYTSPSGLVFYWTLNNLFSLCKTLVYKIPFKKKEHVMRNARHFSSKSAFIGSCLILTLLTGLLIPSSIIGDSPLEFVDPTYFYNPVWYIVNACSLAIGVFIVWFRVFYSLAANKGKIIFERLVEILAIGGIITYMFFGRNHGIMNTSLIYDIGMFFEAKETLINIAVLMGIAVIICLLFYFLPSKPLASVLWIISLSIGLMGAKNMYGISQAIDKYQKSDFKSEAPAVTLSKEGQNVAVLMLDRAMGLYVPYIFNEKPELLESFSGFTYYDNVVSFGAYTNFGTPALLGGYEYIPEEMNKRTTESLKSKHNEALKVMPTIFSESGYDVTLFNPPYANYQWIPDLSIYEDMDVNAYVTYGQFGPVEQKDFKISSTKRNFFCHSLMKIAPLFLQKTIYNAGSYNSLSYYEEEAYVGQSITDISHATGLHSDAMDYYRTLEALPAITSISENSQNTFFFFDSELAHDVQLYDEATYTPSMNIDNSEYDRTHTDRFTVDGHTLEATTPEQMEHYQSNMVTLIKVAKWLDYLKENDVYDNTRIIIVADHGQATGQDDRLIFDPTDETFGDASFFYPLLMVKDFGYSEFTTSHEFMTNADVATLAFKDLINTPVNPFTGNLITDDRKYSDDIYILASEGWGITANNGSIYFADKWLSVHDDIWIKDNWKTVQEESTSPLEYVEWNMDLFNATRE